MGDETPDEVDTPGTTAVKLEYEEFLRRNPESSILDYESEGTEQHAVTKPWGDRSLAFSIPKDSLVLKEVLSQVRLPPRLTAIYHYDTRDLEIIWTAYKLDEEQSELIGRAFELVMPTASHFCEFKDSSIRLLEIARQTLPLGISETGFRNLQSFQTLMQQSPNGHEENNLDAYGKPLSFWISNVDIDDEGLLDLIRHVNFYLRFYDARSPTVEIHPLKTEPYSPKTRYFEGFKFPSKITSHKLDPKLLVIYASAFSDGNTATNFLNLYRVVEYVSYGFMHSEARREVKSVIGRPHALHDLERTATEVLLLMREMKIEREQDSILRLIREVVPPGRLWAELESNRASFSGPVSFEGGLEIPAIATDKTSAETFGSAGVDAFSRNCTRIRNALAHGRDSKTAESILPTARNFEQLRPWLNGISLVAGEVVIWDASH